VPHNDSTWPEEIEPESYVRAKRVVPRMAQATEVHTKINAMAMILLVIVWGFSAGRERAGNVVSHRKRLW